MKAFPLLSVALLAGVVAGCGRSSAASAQSTEVLPPVKARVVVVRTENLPAITEITGTVRPIQRAQLAAKLMGTIDEFPLTLGQRIKRGDVLVKISAGETTARVAQAKSQLNAASRDLERERSLLTKGASTVDMVKGLEDRQRGAAAMLREAEVMLGYATLRAPFDGIVARKLAQAGDLASPGLPLLEIEGASGFEVEAGVPDSLAGTLAAGVALSIEIPAAGVSLTGKITEYSSAADPGARTIAMKIALPEHRDVRSGQFARIQVPGPAVATLLAPAAAVTAAGQMERLFVAANDGRAVLRLVKTGARRGDKIEILSGLDEGERVVVEPPAGLREGQLLQNQP